MRVEDVMTADVAVAKPEMSLKDVARELSGRGIPGMPVVGPRWCGPCRVVSVRSELTWSGEE